MEKKWVGFEGVCGFRRLVYWFAQQYSELQPPGGCGGAVTISDIECGLSGIGCGGYGGGGSIIGFPCIGKLQMIICGNHIGGLPCQPGGGVGSVTPQHLPGGGSIGIIAITTSTTLITSPMPLMFGHYTQVQGS